jgi:hypothetical protein
MGSHCIGLRWQAIARHRFRGGVRSPVKAPSPVVPPSAGAVRHIPWNKVRALDKLACQGAFSLGALAYEPDLSPASFRQTLATEVAELVASARQVLRGDPEHLLPALVRGGLSPGGAQPKALVAFNDDFTRATAGGGPALRASRCGW